MTDDGVTMAALAAAPAADSAGAAYVLEILTAATEAAGRYERADLVARLDRERAAVLAPRCRVLVVGEFKKGKSALVNALLNTRVCAVDAELCTAVPTVIRYGAEPAAVLRTTNQPDRTGRAAAEPPEPAARPVPFTELDAVMTGVDPGAAGNGGMSSDRREAVVGVEVEVPRDLLRDGVELVDTPGVGGGLSSAHAAATLRALVGADVVLFVSDASAEYTAPELDFLRHAADLCPTVVCAVTKIDFYPEWRRILAADQRHLAAVGARYEIVPLSAPLRHHGMRAGDQALLVESGYPRLAGLLREAATGAVHTVWAAAAAAAHATVAQLVSRFSTEYDALADPHGPDDRRAKWTEARQQAEQLRSAGSRWQQVLTDRMTDLASNVDLDLGRRLRLVRKEASDRIAEGDPVLGWAHLEPWLHRRTNEALLDHVRVIREQADAVADDVAKQFGAAAWELRVAVEVEGPGDAARDIGLAAVAADRSSRFQLGLTAARGGSTGFIVSHAVGLVLGLALPVTLPATAVLSTVLARKTWRTARAAQQRALRAEAERAIAAYLDEVELIARKDSRDSVRQVQRQLREVFGQRATELYAATAQNLDALSKAVQEDERTRRGRLAEVGAELEQLRALAARAGALVDRLQVPEPPR